MTYFEASYILLWLIVLILTYISLAMMTRMYRVFLPASDRGMEVGTAFPLPSRDAAKPHSYGANPGRMDGTFVFFTSASCSACKQVYPVIEQFKQKNANCEYMIIMEAEEDEGIRIREGHGITTETKYVDDMTPFEVPGVPFAYFLSPEGKVLSKGIFHHSMHLDHLILSGKRANRKLA